MFNIAPFIPKYVRSLHAVDDNVKIPYSHTQFGVVLMVDVVGFSTLTTLAMERGESGAEAIALEVGSYIGECIQIIEFFGGDVVKFLGDAVLVCFQPLPSEQPLHSASTFLSDEEKKATATRQKHMLVRKAVECGLQLLARLSHYRVYLTAEERSRHRHTESSIDQRANSANSKRFFLFDAEPAKKNGGPSRGVIPPQNTKTSVWSWLSSFFGQQKAMYTGIHRENRRESKRWSMSSEGSDNPINAIDLELHIALSCGDVTNIIIGDIDGSLRSALNPQFRNSAISKGPEGLTNDFLMQYHGRLDYSIGGPVVESLDKALPAARAGEISITMGAYEIIEQQHIRLHSELRRGYHIVRVADMQSKQWPGAKGHVLKLGTEPLVPRIRNSSHMVMPMESNPHYFKYLNRSSLYRLHNSRDGTFTAQFREVTIMFVSLGKVCVDTDDGLLLVQQSVLSVIRLLVKYEGLLQQFAIDDKGATVLGVFGLPPLSHERESVFAAKAAIELRDHYLGLDLPDFSIALSTGIIVNAVLPASNPFRRDPGIAGDAIILAVRMLKFPFSKKRVVCDACTKHQIGSACEFEDLGEKYVKGKVKPVQIYSIQKFGMPKTKRITTHGGNQKTDLIGYKAEMATASQFVNDWLEAQNSHVLVVSGPSGVGKSYFCNIVSKTISSNGTLCCFSSCTEVEKSSKFYLLRSLLVPMCEWIDSESTPAAASEVNSLEDSSTHHLPSSLSSSISGMTGSAGSSPSLSIRQQRPASGLKHWFQRLATRSSGAPPSICGSLPYQEKAGEVADLIMHCLLKCGEKPYYLPLFKVIFTSLNDIDENRYTKHLDARARDILLTDIITRLVRFVSQQIGLVFICDDVQWADSASVRMLERIHERCQHAMIILATRPIKDYNVKFIQEFLATGVHKVIHLNGLGVDEIGEIILQAMEGNVNTVSPEIVRVVQKRTGGNPLYVKNVAIVLKDFNHVTIVDDELVPSSNKFDLEDLLGNFDYKRIIKMQYDRLDANFQEFLTVACFLDQYFTLSEIEAVIKPCNTIFKNKDSEETQSVITKLDVYHFLTQVNAGSPLESDEKETYTFTHITIPESIYTMVSYETRIQLHRLLAKFYESQLTHENYSQMLGKVTRHYRQTDCFGKQLYYLDALADLNMRSYLMPEATANLECIVALLEENEELAASLGKVHLCDIYYRLGKCLTLRSRAAEGERFLIKALQCLGHPWPRTELEFLFKYWKARVDQHRHRHWRVVSHHPRNVAKRQIRQQVVQIMELLSEIYTCNGSGRDFGYTCMVGLNACERLRDNNAQYTVFLARNALRCWLNDDKKKSVFYITKALRHMDGRVDVDTLAMCAFLCFAAGKFTNAREIMYRSIQASKTLGIVTDCQAFYRSVKLVATTRIFEGILDESPDDLMLLKQMGDIAHCNGDHEAEILLGVYNVGNAIVVDRLNDCTSYVALLEAHVKEATYHSRIAIHGTLVGYYARIRNHVQARRHIWKLVAILPILQVTPNILPVFGLIFATMGLYCMIEDQHVHLISASNNFDQFTMTVVRINHAFQQVKFWEFTQPCLYLARALPYISTDRMVEGYTVLRHGIVEMHFIKEIRFLKAYYWACLGKYAFMPCDRIEWTKRAKRDLDLLNIHPDVYCNPDPAKCYSRGIPADVTV